VAIEKRFMMGNEAIARGAAESGVKVVAGYPGTPASEIVTSHLEYPDIHVEWSANEKVALEIALGASLAGGRSLAVMKHNGTNVATDFLMHLNFTGVRGGLVLISADDPGGNSSQNEEDSRIITHLYAHLPLFDPSSPVEAKSMIKAAYELSEQTEVCYVLRPVMRVCHARTAIELEEIPKGRRQPEFVDDRSRFVMSAVVEKTAGGLMRPVVRHRWLSDKGRELLALSEESPFNWIEEGEGRTGLVGCGIGYTYVREAEQVLDRKFPLLKLGTLPLPRQKVVGFARQLERMVVYEETEPVVERMVKEILFEEGVKVQVLGRSSFLPGEGELSPRIVLDSLSKLDPNLSVGGHDLLPLELSLPLRTRTQCVGCGYRGLLYALQRVVRKTKGIVTGDIGCHDMGSFPPMELQSTIYCMGSSIPMATGLVYSGLDRPVFAIIGDSTFFHNGITGLINAVYQGVKLVVVICDNATTAMTGFQPHPGSPWNLRGEEVRPISIEKVVGALGAPVQRVDPYKIGEVKEALEKAVAEPGVSVVISSGPCYLLAGREGEAPFERRHVRVDKERCNACMVCINDFGCPALQVQDGVATIDEITCVQCGMCVEVCHRGAIV
jgi:indolepyruvate ferredoxin oxidoreductase alpha subunit